MGHSKIIRTCFYLKCVYSSTLHSALFIDTFLARVFKLSSLPFARGVAAPMQNGGHPADYCYHRSLGHGLECLAHISDHYFSMGAHLWANKLLIICIVFTVITLYTCIHVSCLSEISFHLQQCSIHINPSASPSIIGIDLYFFTCSWLLCIV